MPSFGECARKAVPEAAPNREMSASTSLLRRISRGLGATALGYGFTLFAQVVSVPLFLKFWGVQLYGEWLVLSTVPGYFAMSDVGFSSVASNQMTMQVADGDYEGALTTFQSTWVFISVLTAFFLIVGVTVVWLLPVERWINLSRLAHSDAATIITLLLLYVTVDLQGTLLEAGFRCVGRYASGTFWGTILRFVELVALLTAVGLGASPSVAASVYLLFRIIAQCGYRLILKRHAPWIVYGVAHARASVVRRLARPAIAFMGFPASNALRLQGTVMLVSILLGPLAVVTFTTVRTLSNAAKRAIGIINHTIWPELSMAFGGQNVLLARRLHGYGCQACVWIGAVTVLVLSYVGPWLIEKWTSEAVHPSGTFLHLMLVSGVVSALWYTSSVVPMAINRHERLAVYIFLGTLLSLVLAGWFGSLWGLSGFAFALLVVDAAITGLVLRMSLDLLDERPSSFARHFIRIPSFLRVAILDRR